MSTYVPIQAITLTSNTTSIEFTGIPQTFTDLVIVCSVRDTAAGTQTYPWIRFNGDSATNYSFTRMHGNGTSAASGRASNQNKLEFCEAPGAGSTANYFAPLIVQVMNYANTTTNKTTLVRTNNVGGAVQAGALACLYRSTSAITSILINGQTALASGSTFTLYGIGSGSPKAFGGDEVRTDGTYWYHIFRSSGRFEPVQDLSCDVLVIAGGGPGGWDIGGGGGAGGYRTATGFNVPGNISYTVTVGAGGAGVNAGAPANGSNSVFSSITSAGGGAGGYQFRDGTAGGSGGGGAASDTTPKVGGAGNTPSTTPSQGNNGGQGHNTNSWGTGGGGGSGAVGSNGSANTGGAGGAGTASSITGSSVTYAGGGGGGGSTTGGAGGTGGGGAGRGADNTAGGNGDANTGSGGGGKRSGTGNSGSGGSGIVVIRYGV